MRIQKFFTLLLALTLSACGTFQVGIEYTPSGTATNPAPSTMDAPATATPMPPSPPDATATATPVPPPPTNTPIPPTPTLYVTPGPQMVQIFLIAVGDNGQTGQMVGCGDSLVPVQVEIPPSQGVLRASLEKLLSLKDQFYGQSGLYDALYQSNLQLESVTLQAGQAVVKLTGTLTLGGECDNPRVAAQLEATVRQFPTVTDASIYINDKLLADALSLK